MPRPFRGRFIFTVTDLALFLGKAPSTLRKWDETGVIDLPRDKSNNRKLTTAQVRDVAQEAHRIKRIPQKRLRLIESTVTLLEMFEKLETERKKK